MNNKETISKSIKSKYPDISHTALTASIKGWQAIQSILNKEPTDFFLCDKLETSDPPKTVWGSAWFSLADEQVIEYYSFLTNKTSNFDLTSLQSTTRLEYQFQGWNPTLKKSPAEDATATVTGNQINDVSFELTAVGDNCRNLVAFSEAFARNI